MDLVILVRAEILPGKPDPNADAQFANEYRAGQYAKMLAASGDYAAVYVIDQNGRAWPVKKED